jgi:hypothetical protein
MQDFTLVAVEFARDEGSNDGHGLENTSGLTLAMRICS